MRSLALALLFLAAHPALGAEAPAAVQAVPASDIERLEKVLDRAQDARARGDLAPERYDLFLIQFRISLEKAWAAGPHIPPAAAAYARILARLGDSAGALASLDPVLVKSPRDAALRLTRGEIALRKGDYATALSDAEAALKTDPADKRALSLKRFSEGRAAGSGENGTPRALANAPGGTFPIGLEASVASRRAGGRLEAVRFTGQALNRLKIGDPDEALRLLALAEASDPTLADVPMQQGLAYIRLRRPREAQPRFAKAEELWNAAGDAQASMARTLKEQAAQAPAAAEPAGAQAPSQRDSRSLDWPLGGAAAGLLLAGLGGSLMKPTETDARWRRPVMIAGMAGVGMLGGGLLGFAGYMLAAPALGGGGTLALAGGATIAVEDVGAGAAAATLVGAASAGTAGAAVGANAREDSPNNTPPSSQAPAPPPKPSPIPIPIPLSPATGNSTDECSWKPSENVLDRFIDRTRLASGFLNKHEGPQRGHTIRDHIKQTESGLRQQLRGGKDEASSYYDERSAEQIIEAAIQNDLPEIKKWFAGSAFGWEVPYIGHHRRPIGYGMTTDNPSAFIPRYDAIVVLRKTPDRCAIYILTSYPR